MIVIVDYEMGNVGSIQNMLRKIGARSTVSRDPEVIHQAGKLILPGVGAFDAGMTKLHQLGLAHVLHERVTDAKVPIMGICLGMQLMTKGSEEGRLPGLGWVDAHTVRFPADTMAPLRIPHMGWNTVTAAKSSILNQDINAQSRFYFVHSYYVRCGRQEDVALRCRYGIEFDAAFQAEHVLGVQFHPEKSHRYGMAMLKSFVEN